MPAPFKIEIVLDEETKARMSELAKFPQRMMPAVQRGMVRGANLAAGNIAITRLQGQGPFPVSEHRLGWVTHRLQQSFMQTDEAVKAGAVNSNEARVSIGTDVEYAAVHEFGFRGEAQVRGHRRRVESRSQFRSVEIQSRKTGAFRKKKERFASGITFVETHYRMMNIPARKWLSTGLQENAWVIKREINAELQDEIDRVARISKAGLYKPK